MKVMSQNMLRSILLLLFLSCRPCIGEEAVQKNEEVLWKNIAVLLSHKAEESALEARIANTGSKPITLPGSIGKLIKRGNLLEIRERNSRDLVGLIEEAQLVTAENFGSSDYYEEAHRIVLKPGENKILRRKILSKGDAGVFYAILYLPLRVDKDSGSHAGIFSRSNSLEIE